MPPPFSRPRSHRWMSRIAVLSVLFAGGGVLACGSEPFGINWAASEDEVFLYSIDRPELNLPTGFDFHNRRQIDIAEVGRGRDWDIAVATRDGELVLMPPGALGIPSEARIAVLPNTELSDVLVAPEDIESYVIDEPVPLRMGDVYVIRSRTQFDFFGFSCVYYAKATPILIETEVEFIRLRFETNPFCNDPRLQPTG